MENSLEIFFAIFWLFLPAAFANMAPVIFNCLPVLATPIDLGANLANKRILGSHKTWRGLVVAPLLAWVIIGIQSTLYPFPAGMTMIDYGKSNIGWFGLILGFGAILGDAGKSFIKRRLNIPPGGNFFIADQIDWILGALIAGSLFYSWPLEVWAIAIIMFGLLHPLANIIGYWFGLKKNKF
ncbi:MAG: CDP-archaeol synthase [Patescibacteria group bacterium]